MSPVRVPRAGTRRLVIAGLGGEGPSRGGRPASSCGAHSCILRKVGSPQGSPQLTLGPGKPRSPGAPLLPGRPCKGRRGSVLSTRGPTASQPRGRVGREGSSRVRGTWPTLPSHSLWVQQSPGSDTHRPHSTATDSWAWVPPGETGGTLDPTAERARPSGGQPGDGGAAGGLVSTSHGRGRVNRSVPWWRDVAGAPGHPRGGRVTHRRSLGPRGPGGLRGAGAGRCEGRAGLSVLLQEGHPTQ